MKKSIRIVLFLLIYIAKTALLFSQENNGRINLSGLFNECDHNPTTVSNSYTQLPDGLFSHAQIMNIPASNQADLLHKVLIIVDSTLYSELDFEINRYAYDIHYVYGCNVIMEQVDSETYLDIKSLIVSYQNNLDGCVLIGDIAPAFYKTADVIHNNEIAIWPCSPNSEGLSVVGSTKVGGMYPFARFYISLGSGKTMGQSLVDWWRNNNANSPLSYYLASERITVPSAGSFIMPVGDHCIINAPTVEIHGAFLCPLGSTLEIQNEGCRDNCEE